jgi:hypothetical protein
MIRGPCGSHVLYAAAAGIEDHQFIGRQAPLLAARCKVRKIGVHAVFRDGARSQGMVEVAAGGTGFRIIDQDARPAHQARSYVVLLGIVGPNRRHEAASEFRSSVRTGDLEVVQVMQMSTSATAALTLGAGVMEQSDVA